MARQNIEVEESYDIDSELSEDDCRQDIIKTNHTNGDNPLSDIHFNESMTMQLNIDDDDEGDDHQHNNNNGIYSSNIKAASIRSESIDIDIDAQSQGTMIEHNSKHKGRPIRSQTIEIFSEENLKYHNYEQDTKNWFCFGRCYRRCCFSALGIKITIFLNLLMILLNSGLIIYEIILIIQDKSLMHTQLPLWYIICDFIITIILFFEMLFTVAAIYKGNICKYFKSGWECWIDVIVLILSVGCCAAYYFDFADADIDNLTMLFVRVIRDIIRIVRCLWFFKMLYSNLIRLGIRKNTMMSFRGEPLLANKAWKSKYKLQINSSPKSTQSDQREYKGPKRVDIYDEDDIKNLMHKEDEKLKYRQMYSLTPSPPNSKKTTPHQSNTKRNKTNSFKKQRHKNRSRIISSPSGKSHQRNLTRNCDEFTVDQEMNNINKLNMNDKLSDDRSDVISINSGINSGSNGSIVHHRHTSTRILGSSHDNTDVINSYDAESGISYLTSGTNDNYYDNLKLRHIKKKSVDKQRLRELLKNLPSGSIIERESFSIEDDEGDGINVGSHRLHSESDKLQII